MREKYSWSTLFSNIGEWFDTSVKPWFTAEKWSELWEEVKSAFSTKWEEIVSWWKGTAIYGWWNEHVAPWFTTEKWSGIFANIQKAFSDKWNALVTWWKGTAISKWWSEHVTPWFTKEKWSGIFKNIKESLLDIWNKTVGQWKQNISKWWGSLTWEEIAAILNAVMNKNKYSFYHKSPLVPCRWITSDFYSADYSMEAQTLKDNEEKWTGLSISLRSIEPV